MRSTRAALRAGERNRGQSSVTPQVLRKRGQANRARSPDSPSADSPLVANLSRFAADGGAPEDGPSGSPPSETQPFPGAPDNQESLRSGPVDRPGPEEEIGDSAAQRSAGNPRPPNLPSEARWCSWAVGVRARNQAATAALCGFLPARTTSTTFTTTSPTTTPRLPVCLQSAFEPPGSKSLRADVSCSRRQDAMISPIILSRFSWFC
jgi:hypothetical protein